MGFRPFVYGLAIELRLSGFVANTSNGVVAEVEGGTLSLEEFRQRLTASAPPAARIETLRIEDIASRGDTGFSIVGSSDSSGHTLVSPDLGTCSDCIAEISDSANRRYRHPFTSCTNCGPRFTVIQNLPYDRSKTTMAPMPLCVRCADEYADPADRRFHCQTVACWDCGPTLTLRDPDVVTLVRQ